MTDAIIPQIVRSLENVNKYLDKAEEFARTKKADVNVLMQWRLAPDQYAFNQQVMIACDNAKGMAARLSGKTPPKHEDTQKTPAELRQRVQMTVDFIKSIPAADYKGWEERACELPWMPGKYLVGSDYLSGFALQNFYFHLATAYACLRNAGVDLGKMDFMAELSWRDKK